MFDLLLTLGHPLKTNAFGETFDLFFVDVMAAEFNQIETGLAEGDLVGPSVTDEVEQGDAIVPHIDAQTFGLGKECLATVGAIAVWFEPLDGSGVAVKQARFW